MELTKSQGWRCTDITSLKDAHPYLSRTVNSLGLRVPSLPEFQLNELRRPIQIVSSYENGLNVLTSRVSELPPHTIFDSMRHSP